MALSPLTGVRRAVTAVGVSAALVAGGLVAPAFAEAKTPSRLLPNAACVAGTPIEIYSFNDFHGRIGSLSGSTYNYLAAKLFTPVEQSRAAGNNVVLLSNGDSIGGSTFESASQNDNPTIAILNAIGLQASATGNHEYDKGMSDLQSRYAGTNDNVVPQFPMLVSNVRNAAGNVPAPLKAYEIIEVDHDDAANTPAIRIGVIGAVTGDLPGLVSPGGIAGLTVGDPVQAVNDVAADIADETDIIVAQIHEGAANGSGTAASNAAASPAFKSIHENISTDVNVVFTGHTHQLYNWTTSDGRPLLQAASYATKLAKVTVNVEDNGTICGDTTAALVDPAAAPDVTLPAIQEIVEITQDAIAESDVVGAVKVATTDGPLSLPNGLNVPDVRDLESPITNLVAEFFGDVLSNNDQYRGKKIIGVQNPGGTRAGLPAGDVTYKDAALALPFANTIKTTELTGAQFKKVLEQQWQRLPNGTVPSRAYLRLGLSPNTSYTYDESLPEGSRITGIYFEGQPISDTDVFTLVSGNFLIEGGDQFYEFANGANTRDTGLVDLTAFTEWVGDQGTISAPYGNVGASVKGATQLVEGQSATFQVGVPQGAGLARETLDSTGLNATKNTTATAYIVQGSTKLQVGSAAVVDGRVTNLQVQVPVKSGLNSGGATLLIEATPGGTTVQWAVNIVAAGPTFAWGDQSGDKIGDIIAVDANGVLNTYYGRSGGLSSLVTKAGGGWNNFTWISHTPDVNGDGIDDLLARKANGELLLYFGATMGQFSSPRLVGTGWNNLAKLAVVGDMTGDGSPEVVGIGTNGNLYRYTLTTGGLKDARHIGKNWQSITQITSVGDFNGDGTADILATNAAGDLFTYYTGPGGTIIQAAKTGQGWAGFTAFFAPGDLNNDGRVDLVGRKANGVLFLYTNDGNGKWGVAKQIGHGWNGFTLFA
ncbi:5'-nucleotidase C-terminal domain-containing protein [Propionibacteriaceae bacterium Y1923]